MVLARSFEYEIPMLVDIKVSPHDAEERREQLAAQHGMFYRERIAFDDQELPRDKKVVVVKSNSFLDC